MSTKVSFTTKEAFFRLETERLSPACQLAQAQFGGAETLLKDEILREWKEIWYSRVLLKPDRQQLMDPTNWPSLIHQLQNRSYQT